LDVPRNRGEDLIQEAALRVVLLRVPFDDAAHLYRWAAVVVRRLAIDGWRRDRVLTGDEPLNARPSQVDVAWEVVSCRV